MRRIIVSAHVGAKELFRRGPKDRENAQRSEEEALERRGSEKLVGGAFVRELGSQRGFGGGGAPGFVLGIVIFRARELFDDISKNGAQFGFVPGGQGQGRPDSEDFDSSISARDSGQEGMLVAVR